MRRPITISMSRGFSLIELVAVIVIIGALAIFVAPRLNIAGFSEFSFHERVFAAVRHAQKTATATRCAVRFKVVAGADKYVATFDDAGPPQPGAGPKQCTAGNALSAPGGSGDLSGTAPDGVTLTLSGPDIVLNGFGVPGNGTRSIAVGGRQVVIEANTGYVHD